MSRCLSGLLFLVCASTVFADPPGQPTPWTASTILMYCDDSPGAVAQAIAWQKTFTQLGKTWHYATSAAQLSALISNNTYSRILVFSKHTTQEPEFIQVCRNHAIAHTECLVFLWNWNDNGANPAPLSLVLGTTAIAVWHNGKTRFSYELSANPAAVGESLVEVMGYVQPDFNGIIATPLTTVGTWTQTVIDGHTVEFQALPGDPSLERCKLEYSNRLEVCWREFNDEINNECYPLHGPNAPNGGDPDQLQTCISDAADALVGCTGNALRRFKNCKKLLGVEEEATTQPANPSGG